jgi:Tfp pilus assembly protein PilF
LQATVIKKSITGYMTSKIHRSIVASFFLIFASMCFSAGCFGREKKASEGLSYYILGLMYDRMGQADKAIESYQKALRQDFQNSAIHLGLGSGYLKKNNTSKAIEELNLAAQFDPESVEPHAILSLLYFSQANLAEAGKEYETALQKASALEPKNIVIYKSLGVVYLQKKDFVAAEKIYKLILDIAPDDAEAHFYLANIYDERRNRAAAEIELKKALELKSDYAQALNYLGYLYIEENKNLPEAKTLITKALEIEPENGAYIDSLGWFYFKLGKIEDAIQHLEKASKLLEDPIIFDHLGDAYFKSNDIDKAKLNWQMSLKLDAAQENIKKKLKSLEKNNL